MSGYLLVGDVGPSRMVLAVASADAATLTDVAEVVFAAQGGRPVEERVRDYLAELELEVAAACFSVAGPIVDDQVWFPSSDLRVSRPRLREALGLEPVVLVNDLQATARALPHLGRGQVALLQMGVPDPDGPRAVLSAGAGLGEALLVTHGGRRIALPTEAGHADFAPNGPLQEELLSFLRGEMGHVSWESVCSLRGIANLYRFLRARSGEPEPGWLADTIAAADHPATAILAAGTGEPARDAVCREALELFAAILGAEAGNLALRSLSSGGLYVGGDLPAALLPVLKGGGFLAAFRHKGPLSDLIRRIPVHVVLEPQAALLGAAQYARAAAPAVEVAA